VFVASSPFALTAMSSWDDCMRSAELGDLAVRMNPGRTMTFWHVLGNGAMQLAVVESMAADHMALHLAASEARPTNTPAVFVQYELTTQRTANMIAVLRDAIAVPALWEA
jgi:hypothetical protein